MTSLEHKLDATLVWDGTGHLADAAVNAVADGELDLLPDEALQHADSCGDCASRIGETALFALEIAEAIGAQPLAQLAPEPAHARRRPLPVAVPSPWRPLALALAIAVVSVLPSVQSLAPKLVHVQAFSATALPLLAQLITHLGASATKSGLAYTVALTSAALLAMAGAAVARWARPAARKLEIDR